METPTFLFDGKNTTINTNNIPGHELTGSLKAFTIATTIELDEFKNNEMTLVGHSGCACYALVIDKSGEVILRT